MPEGDPAPAGRRRYAHGPVTWLSTVHWGQVKPIGGTPEVGGRAARGHGPQGDRWLGNNHGGP